MKHSMTREEYYNEVYFPAEKSSDILENNKFSKLFHNETPINKIILDVGCGPGVTLKSITKENTVFGIDLCNEYLCMARTNGYYKTIKHDLENGLPCESCYFDIVICADLIEHVFETEFIGKEIYRVLKDEGYAILNVPNHNELGRRLRFLLGKGINVHRNIEDGNYFHIRFFTWKSWNSYLKKIGFKVVEFYPIPSRIGIPIPRFIKNKFITVNSLETSEQSKKTKNRYNILKKLYDMFNFSIPVRVSKKFPNLLSYSFMVKVVKN
jgi:SAM-dependent methyltransferase